MIAKLAAVATVLVGLIGTSVASQEKGVDLGVLDCAIEGGTGLVFGSTKDIRCTFTPFNAEFLPESYFGVVTKYGLDIGSTSQTIMQWLVLAPSTNIYAPGALAGDYIGASAEITAGLGAGANVLIGGAGPTYVLQPLSLQTQKGINLAVGVSQFQLRSMNN